MALYIDKEKSMYYDFSIFMHLTLIGNEGFKIWHLPTKISAF